MIDQHDSLAEKFIKKGFWLYLFSFIIGPIGYGIKILISESISVSDLGILYGIISLVYIFSSYNDFGMTESMNYFIPKYLEKKEFNKVKNIIIYSLGVQTFTSVTIGCLLYFFSEYIGIHYFNSSEASEVLKIFILFFFGINIYQVFSTFFIAIQNTFLHKGIEFLRNLILFGYVGFLYFLDTDSLKDFSFAWVFGLYIGIIIALSIFYFKYYIKYFKQEKFIFEKTEFKQILSYAFTVLLGAQAGMILSQIDMQMIIYYLGSENAGYYSNYLSIIGIPFIIIGPIFTLLLPIFSQLDSQNKIDSLKDIKYKLQNIFVLISIAINLLFFVFGKELAYIFFGEKYITSGVILQYSILFLSFNFLLQINFLLLSGIGKTLPKVKIIGSAIVLNGILNYIGIQYIGVAGAAIATGLGWVYIWVCSEISLGKNFLPKFNFIEILGNIICLGTILFIFNKYNTISLLSLHRLELLGIFIIISIIYFGIFIGINFKKFHTLVNILKKKEGIKK